MAGIRLEWAQFGDFDSFDVIRSTNTMNSIADNDLPAPMITGLKTMYFVDESVVLNSTYYYKVRANRDNFSVISSEIKAKANAYDGLVISDDPIAYYRLDEVSGSTAYDVGKGSAANGTINGCLLGQEPLGSGLDKSFYFDGSNNYILLGAPSKFLINGSISVECWIKKIVSNGGNTLQINNNQGIRMQIGSSANLIFADANKLSSPDLENNKIYHVVFTCSSSKLQIFINGNLSASLSGGSWRGIQGNQNSAIGMSGVNNEFFKGNISNVALYDKELSAEQILRHYQAGI